MTPARQHPFHLKYRQRRLFARDVSAQSEIRADKEHVWAALIDFDHYPEWNRFTTRVESDLNVGSPVKLHVDMPDRSASIRTEWINLVEPGETLCWGMHMGLPWLLCANRWQILTTLENGHTEYLTVDKFSGLLTPIVMLFYGKPMQKGFQAVADGLKEWVEQNDREDNA